jgi:thymidylate synthase
MSASPNTAILRTPLMRKTIPQIEVDNLALAWARAFVEAYDSPGGALSRLVVTTRIPDGGIAAEVPAIRSLVDSELEKRRESTVNTVANTIFPESLWNPAQPAQTLFDRYDRVWPRVHRCHANNNGVYFRRLTAFGNPEDPVNQLSHIISTWRDRGNHRHSALQAAIFDPNKDHNNSRQRGFPCLHQIAFDAQGANGREGLVVTGFYAKQNLFEKAYGNYLGLARLGKFMAHEMRLQLVEVTCIASVAVYAEHPKRNLQELADGMRAYLQ